MTKTEARYSAVLQDLYQRTTQGIKLGLDNTRQLLDALGNPQEHMRHIVVAGTNGKGSTSSLMATVLEESGIPAGLYTSPHLLRYTERIKLRGTEISQRQVIDYYDRIREIESKCESLPTFFEVTTAMALLAFKEASLEYAVLEVGLGGRLDSTNVVDKFLSIITPIGLDHIHILGDTIEEIAAEKAGIIQANRPVLLAPQSQAARLTLETIANSHEAQVFHSTPHKLQHGELTIELEAQPSKSFKFDGPSYQASNAATVFSATQILCAANLEITADHFQAALESWQWAGRFQRIQAQAPVILDGAHNPHAIEALFEALPKLTERPLHVVFSALHTKDAALMIRSLDSQSTSLHLAPSSVGKSLQHEDLRALAPNLPVYDHSLLAFDKALSLAKNDGGQVLVTGSLFLVADILHHLSGEERDPGIAS
jgi:dihydrofolate synthase / folylpolyglutamate synthase